MVQVQGRSAPWVVEESRLEMFGEEAVFYFLKRNRTPLTGVGGGGKGKAEDRARDSSWALGPRPQHL